MNTKQFAARMQARNNTSMHFLSWGLTPSQRSLGRRSLIDCSRTHRSLAEILKEEEEKCTVNKLYLSIALALACWLSRLRKKPANLSFRGARSDEESRISLIFR